jgi:DNA-binding response OmpR family regulator
MRLLLIEDNDRLSILLAEGLGSAGFTVDRVRLAADAFEAATAGSYAAMVLDLGLPDGNGLDLLVRLRRAGNAAPILVLTARGSTRERVAGLKAGADDYMGKPFALEELVARLQALLRRPGHLLGAALTVGNVVFDTVARQVTVSGETLTASLRELAVLEILMRRHGRVVPKKLVEDQLYGLAGAVGSNAVEVYIYRVRKRLETAGASTSIHTIRGVGYMITAGK